MCSAAPIPGSSPSPRASWRTGHGAPSRTARHLELLADMSVLASGGARTGVTKFSANPRSAARVRKLGGVAALTNLAHIFADIAEAVGDRAGKMVRVAGPSTFLCRPRIPQACCLTDDDAARRRRGNIEVTAAGTRRCSAPATRTIFSSTIPTASISAKMCARLSAPHAAQLLITGGAPRFAENLVTPVSSASKQHRHVQFEMPCRARSARRGRAPRGLGDGDDPGIGAAEHIAGKFARSLRREPCARRGSQPPGKGLPRIKAAVEQDDLPALAAPTKRGRRIGAAPARQRAKRHFRQAEGGTFAADAVVAAQGKLEAAAQAEPSMAAITGRGCCSMMSPTACPRSVWAMRSFSPGSQLLYVRSGTEGLPPAPPMTIAAISAQRHFFQVLLQQQQGASSSALRRCSLLIVSEAIPSSRSTISESAIKSLPCSDYGEGRSAQAKGNPVFSKYRPMSIF